MENDNFLDYLRANKQYFSLTKIEVELCLPNKLLFNYVKQTKYRDSLGDFEGKVKGFFAQLGYREDGQYNQFL